MYVAELRFRKTRRTTAHEVSHAVIGLLVAWRESGQLYNEEWPMAMAPEAVVSVVRMPERRSLAKVRGIKAVVTAMEAVKAAGLEPPDITVLGPDVEGDRRCRCPQRTSLILKTDFLSIESPLRCGDCYGHIPLYETCHSPDQDYRGIVRWQSDYNACDRLQIGCHVLERAATREMSHPASRLSQTGIDICRETERSIGVPVYYYLYRYGARSRRKEEERKCPGCGGEWRLEEPWHIFDFRCDSCRLLSNIAWDVR
jgi:predicted  nucleic acid-binding Zn ribbon protein